MPSNRKKKRRESKKKKVKTAVSPLIPKTILKFCFLRMPELHSKVYDLWMDLWYVLSLKSHTVTRTQLNYLQKAFFGKISRSKWVNEGLMAIKKIIFQTNFFQQHYILLTGVVSWGPILARIPPSIFSLSWRTLEFSYVKYFGIGISMSSYK